ncbi:MAG: sigma-54 dependent transcriptional regulator [Nitrospirota bacterium]
MNPAVLLIDDEPGIQFGFSKYLTGAGYSITGAANLSEAREALLAQRFDAVLLDLNLPDGSGLDFIVDLRESCPAVPLIIITGIGDIPLAVEAMRRGADNFLTKPVNMADLDVFLRKSLELGVMRRRSSFCQRTVKSEQPYFGESAVMRNMQDLATVAAASDSPVMLLGETGTGKGVYARWIHENSSRAREPFVEVNCSSLRGELLSSELFGHARGAFTSALQDRQGLIEVADRGTLFLDELGDMDPGVQAQFLKVIEEKHFRRLGEVKMRRSEFRLICATNKDLSREVEQGTFRRDLYFRSYVFPIHLPPLRERPEDIPPLAHHILALLGAPEASLSPELLQLLQSYAWPGNIREMRNVIERALLLARGGALQPGHFPGIGTAADPLKSVEDIQSLESLETASIREALRRFNGDTKKAAGTLGISRATLYRKLKKL